MPRPLFFSIYQLCGTLNNTVMALDISHKNPVQPDSRTTPFSCAVLWVLVFLAVSITDSRALTPTVLHAFSVLTGPQQTNLDGANLAGDLLLVGNMLYGTASHGGTHGLGCIFAVNTNGLGFTNLYNFSAVSGPAGTNADGAYPLAGLVLASNVLYGTASRGGAFGAGTVFQLSLDGTGFSTLHNFSALAGILFSNMDGAHPQAPLLPAGQTLYGTAGDGGTSGNGTVFAFGVNGTGFKTLHNFPPAYASTIGYYTNVEGANPAGGLVLGNGSLFGTTVYGGRAGQGVVFTLNTNGSGFVNLHDFDLPARDSSGTYTNAYGANPSATLSLSGNILYGTAQNAGAHGAGTCFSLRTDGSSLTPLHSFNPTNDGANPVSSLVLLGQTLLGTAATGTASGQGAVFMLNVDGTAFTNLYGFPSLSSQTNTAGANPIAGLVYSAGTIYGAAYDGGPSGTGSLFSLSPLELAPPLLAISRSGPNVILTWPGQASMFSLQTATNLHAPLLWTNVSAVPALVNGLNTVTNPFAGADSFFRLSR